MVTAAERCQWEVLEDGRPCPKRAVWPANDYLGVYCAEHLAIWRKELERREERDRPKLSPEVQDWYQRMAKREARQCPTS